MAQTRHRTTGRGGPRATHDRGPVHKDTHGCVQALVDLYTAWDKAEPGNGSDAKAAEWRAKLPTPEPAVEPADKR